ncbi:MAG: hypothetical protein ACK58T_20880 [Phycisphaerae bacterium]|jgi:hypothetical protein
MTYSDAELEEAAEHVIKAEEIRNNQELMKELEPYLKEKMARIDKVLTLKDLWKLGIEKASEEEAEEKKVKKAYYDENSPKKEEPNTINGEENKIKGEKTLIRDEPKIGAKA